MYSKRRSNRAPGSVHWPCTFQLVLIMQKAEPHEAPASAAALIASAANSNRFMSLSRLNAMTRAALPAARTRITYAIRSAAVPGQGLEETAEKALLAPRRSRRLRQREAAGTRRCSERREPASRPRRTATNYRRRRRGPIRAGRPATSHAVQRSKSLHPNAGSKRCDSLPRAQAPRRARALKAVRQEGRAAPSRRPF